MRKGKRQWQSLAGVDMLRGVGGVATADLNAGL